MRCHGDTVMKNTSRKLATKSPIIDSPQPPAWLANRIKQLDQMSQLPANWDSYGAEAVSQTSVNNAKAALEIISRVVAAPIPWVTANPNGEVSVSWGNDDAVLEVEFPPSGQMPFHYLCESDPRKDLEGVATDVARLIELLTEW